MIRQLDDGTTVADIHPGTSRLAINPAIGRPAEVMGCYAKSASNILKGRLFMTACSASDGLFFGFAPPLSFAMTILESPNGSFEIVSAYGTSYPSVEVWQYGNGSPAGYWYDSSVATGGLLNNAIGDINAIVTRDFLHFQPVTSTSQSP